MVTIYNTTLSATSQRHFSDSLGGGPISGTSGLVLSAGPRFLLARHFGKPVESIFQLDEND